MRTPAGKSVPTPSLDWKLYREIARQQLERDRAFTDGKPLLLARKLGRMTASPFAFLRGTAPLFYQLLALDRDLADGPSGEGWLVGDAHLENFGAYRVEPDPSTREKKAKDAKGEKSDKSSKETKDEKSEVVFHLNDFDDACWGPLRWDALRLLTSVLVFATEQGLPLGDALTLASAMLEGYCASRENGTIPVRPRIVERLIQTTTKRSRQDLLDARTTIVKGDRRFKRGEHYQDLAPEIHAGAVDAFARYGLARIKIGHATAEQLETRDLAFRIAGVGSLGSLRVAVLTRGKGGADGSWLFDMKEEESPSILNAGLDRQGHSVTPPHGPPRTSAGRVIEAVCALLPRPPRMIGETSVGPTSMLVRWLAPQEDKLAIASVPADERIALVGFLGSLLGEAHGRASPKAPRWNDGDRAELLHRAIALAAIHQAAFAEYAMLASASR